MDGHIRAPVENGRLAARGDRGPVPPPGDQQVGSVAVLQ
jgi:hypothetical protein